MHNQRRKNLARRWLDQVHISPRVGKEHFSETRGHQRAPDIRHLLALKSTRARGPKPLAQRTIGLRMQRAVGKQHEANAALLNLRSVLNAIARAHRDLEPKVLRHASQWIGGSGR